MECYLRAAWKCCLPILVHIVCSLPVEMSMQFFSFADEKAAWMYFYIARALVTILVCGCWYRKCRDSGSVRTEWTTEKNRYIVPVFWTVIAGIGACAVGNLVVILLSLHSPSYESAKGSFHGISMGLELLAFGVLTPLAEELVFRGLGFMRAKKEIGFWAAALLSALLFGCFHGNIVQGVYAFGIGLLLAWACEQYHALWPALTIHMAANIFAVCLNSAGLLVWMYATPVKLLIAGVFFTALLCVGIRNMKQEGMKGRKL